MATPQANAAALRTQRDNRLPTEGANSVAALRAVVADLVVTVDVLATIVAKLLDGNDL